MKIPSIIAFMMTLLNELMLINQRVLNYSGKKGFREEEVVCLSKDGRKIRFTPSKNVPSHIIMILQKFSALFTKAKDAGETAEALAFFWLGFIAVHPFADGNGRTAKEFLRSAARNKGYVLNNISALDGLLLRGKTSEDLDNLKMLFLNNLRQKEIS